MCDSFARNRLFTGGWAARFIETLITDGSTLGEIPNIQSTEKSITPTVATGPQSVKRGEKQNSSEPNGVNLLAGIYGQEYEQV